MSKHDEVDDDEPRTMETGGPDDDYTHLHACREGRGCFESAE